MKQMKRPTLNELFPNWVDGQSIFKRLNEMFDLPWKNDFQPLDIDIDYFGKYGTRLVSNLALQLINKYKVFDDRGRPIVDDNNEPLVTDDNLSMLCKIIYRRFGVNWTKLYETLSFEYNPIENYSMTENENVKSTKDSTNSQTATNTTTGRDTTTGQGTKSGTNSHTGSKKNTGTVGVENDGTGSIYGFNSTNKSDVSATEGSSTTTNDLTESTTMSSTDSETTTDSVVVDTTNSKNDSVNTTEQDEQETIRSHTRSGNIGVTTSQQMIESERKLWLYDYFDTVYKQINSILTIPYYE